MNNVLNAINKTDCVGCKACSDVCPKASINFCEDNEGFWYPDINKNSCINCGLCIKVCPITNEKASAEYDAKAYMAWSKEPSVRDASTSGGIFYELAKAVLDEGGYVAGATYSDDYKSVSHILINKFDDLHKLVGSKYLQSDTNNVFSSISDKLKKGNLVLFAGTPCQGAALKTFLENQKVNTEHLLVMDFVCNSIYSPLVYRKWLEELEKRENSKVVRVRAKSKKYGWTKRYQEISFDNGKTVYVSDDKGENLYIAGIQYFNLYQRECCYNCKFREEQHRYSDITVGDYWGTSRESLYDMFKGISFVIANSQKGNDLFMKVRRSVFIKPSTIEDIKKGQERMLNSPVRNSKRDVFFEALKTNDFSKALNSATGYKVPSSKNELKELFKYIKRKDISIWKYVYLNFFCKNVIRKADAKIIPYKNSVIEFGKNSKLILEGYHDFCVGINKLKGSKAETYLKLERDAQMWLLHGGDMFYGSTVEIKNNAKFKSGYFGMNTGSVIVCDLEMEFGEYVGLGRNNMIYDSDFHMLLTSSGKTVNYPKKIKIGDHVWIPSNTIILPGAKIGDNVVISPHSIVKSEVCSNSFFRDGMVTPFPGWWSDTAPNKYAKVLSDKKIIMVGYGYEGRQFYKRYKGKVSVIIDNASTDENVVSFAKFCKSTDMIDDDSIFVITSSKYFDELYDMVRSKYTTAVIIPGTTI